MELITILSTIILVATISTFILSILSYCLFPKIYRPVKSAVTNIGNKICISYSLLNSYYMYYAFVDHLMNLMPILQEMADSRPNKQVFEISTLFQILMIPYFVAIRLLSSIQYNMDILSKVAENRHLLDIDLVVIFSTKLAIVRSISFLRRWCGFYQLLIATTIEYMNIRIASCGELSS